METDRRFFAAAAAADLAQKAREEARTPEKSLGEMVAQVWLRGARLLPALLGNLSRPYHPPDLEFRAL